MIVTMIINNDTEDDGDDYDDMIDDGAEEG